MTGDINIDLLVDNPFIDCMSSYDLVSHIYERTRLTNLLD